jgi:hypothetical protein
MRPYRASGLAFALLACAGQAPLALGPEKPALAIASPSVVAAPLVSAAPASLAAPRAEPGTQAASAVPEVLPVSLGDIGKSGPVQVLATSSSGAWLALCDADAKTASLVLGSGLGESIDELLAQDPSGRYVVSARDGVATLVDTRLGTRVDLSALGADVRRVRADYAEHRTLSFDAHGQHLAYLRKLAQASQLVVRSLPDGAEQVVSAGPGEVFRLKLSADARYVTFDALREDSNHNGKLDWPAPEEPARKNACEKPNLPKFRSFAYQGRGDALTRGVMSVQSGALRDVPDLLTPLGANLLVREADGSLQLEQAGKRTPFAPASCGARLLFADAERGLVVATCAPPLPKKKPHAPTPPPSGKREVWLFASGYAKNLQRELYETSTDREAVTGARLVAIYPGSESSLLDLERRELLPLTAGSRVVATNGALALIWRDSDLYRYDAVSKTEQRLAHGVSKNPDLLQAGNTVLLSPFVIVGCDAPALASPPQALAVSSSGFVLTGTVAPTADTAGSPAIRTAIQGPLHWVDAKVAPPNGPPR